MPSRFKLSRFFMAALLGPCALTIGCGVKGKPLPPLKPAPIGDGRLKYNQPEPAKAKK